MQSEESWVVSAKHNCFSYVWFIVGLLWLFLFWWGSEGIGKCPLVDEGSAVSGLFTCIEINSIAEELG